MCWNPFFRFVNIGFSDILFSRKVPFTSIILLTCSYVCLRLCVCRSRKKSKGLSNCLLRRFATKTVSPSRPCRRLYSFFRIFSSPLFQLLFPHKLSNHFFPNNFQSLPNAMHACANAHNRPYHQAERRDDCT